VLGIHALVNLVSRRRIKGWARQIICATIVARLIDEHLQGQQQQNESAPTAPI
jgi:hypothetical protein